MPNHLNETHLQTLLNRLTVSIQTSDRSEYTIPKDKLLLLFWKEESFTEVAVIDGILIQDGAGVEGNQQLLELYNSVGEILFDAYFDDCPFDLERSLKLIDNPL